MLKENTTTEKNIDALQEWSSLGLIPLDKKTLYFSYYGTAYYYPGNRLLGVGSSNRLPHHYSSLSVQQDRF